MSKIFIALGIIFLVLGIVLYYFPNVFSWFGRLPGDLRVHGKSGSFFFPIVSSIVISILLTVVVNVFFRR